MKEVGLSEEVGQKIESTFDRKRGSFHKRSKKSKRPTCLDRKIHLSRKIQYVEFFSMLSLVTELYFEKRVHRMQIHRKEVIQ